MNSKIKLFNILPKVHRTPLEDAYGIKKFIFMSGFFKISAGIGRPGRYTGGCPPRGGMDAGENH